MLTLKISGNTVTLVEGKSGRIMGSVDFTGYGGLESANVSGDGWFARTREGVTMVFDGDCRLLNSYS